MQHRSAAITSFGSFGIVLIIQTLILTIGGVSSGHRRLISTTSTWLVLALTYQSVIFSKSNLFNFLFLFYFFSESVFPIWKKLRYTYLTLEEDVIQLLSALRKHYTVGLITNGPSRSQWEKIAQIHAEQFFDLIIVSGDLSGCEKPQAEIFHLACQQLNVKPNKSCMIGDRLDTDILGGQNAGLATVWIPLNGECAHMPTSHNPPDFTIDCLMDLAPMFGITADEMRSSI